MKTSYTKLAVADALLELLAAKEYQSISVHELCLRAGICKRTFYNHFKDKYEVLPWFWRYHLDPCMGLPLPAYCCEALKLIGRYFPQFQRAFHYNGQNNFVDFVKLHCSSKYRMHLSNTIYQKYSPETVERALAYGSLSAIYGVTVLVATSEHLSSLMDSLLSDTDNPLRLLVPSIFSDYLSFTVLPEGKHI